MHGLRAMKGRKWQLASCWGREYLPGGIQGILGILAGVAVGQGTKENREFDLTLRWAAHPP